MTNLDYPNEILRQRRILVLTPRARWSPTAKAVLAQAILDGTITAADAMEAHQLGGEEVAAWCEAWRRGGVPALRVTRPERRRA